MSVWLLEALKINKETCVSCNAGGSNSLQMTCLLARLDYTTFYSQLASLNYSIRYTARKEFHFILGTNITVKSSSILIL